MLYIQPPTTLTFNGRSSLDGNKSKENLYTGLENSIVLNRKKSAKQLSPDFYESDDDGLTTRANYEQQPHQQDQHNNKYHSFSRYTTPKSYDNWSYSTMTMGSHRASLPTESKYVRRSLNKRYAKKENTNVNNRPRPKPLQYDNEKYYEHVFPKRDAGRNYCTDVYYQPNSLEQAEL